MSNTSLLKLMTSTQICELFSIKRRTLDNWIALRKIPTGFIVGGRRYWHPQEITSFLAARSSNEPVQGSRQSNARG